MAAKDNDAVSQRLRDVVTLIVPASPEDRNELGEPIQQESVEARVRANVETLSGRELVYAQQVAAEATDVVEIRWRPGVTRFKSLLFGTRRLNIDAVIDKENLQITLFLYCREER